MELFDRLFSALGLREQATEAAPATDRVASTDVVRDPELEARDDSASFDFDSDVTRYFTAEFRIEQSWPNRERRELLFAEYEIRDGAHWFQVKATFERWLESPTGKARFPTEEALMRAYMTTTQTT